MAKAADARHSSLRFQGLLKVVAGLEISFTLTSKGGDDENVDELHTFKFSWLLLPGCFIGLFNIVGIIVGVARAVGSSSSQEWGASLSIRLCCMHLSLCLHQG